MKSIRRCQHIISFIIVMFIIGMAVLVLKIQREAPFYMMNSDHHELGFVYDRKGDVLFDGTGENQYPDNYFIDIGNIIGDDSGQMNNTLVAQNIEKLNNYSFSGGLTSNGRASIYTTMDHEANRAVYNAFGYQEGCVVAYNYATGDILVSTSLPSIDVTKGYDAIDSFKPGTLMSKTLYKTIPGSTQKVSTVVSALEIMGAEKLFSKSFTCTGQYINRTGLNIDCHNIYGHGTLNIQQAVENSCNPFFAQLIEDDDLPLDRLIEQYRKLGYAVNGDEDKYFDIDGIQCERASTNLTDKYEFTTQWGCIGQGDTIVSPMQLMMWQSAIANGTGRMTMPHLIDHCVNVNGTVTDTAKVEYSEQLFSPDTAATMKQILLTNGANHYAYSISGYNVGVKSGTAQVDEGANENSLLVGFVDDPAFPVAFCILIEKKNEGFLTTEQIAQVLLDNLRADF
ncbi:MAG TPA: penicillin-binding transpeptidase domain-containing protein [Ruminococcus flavefaciens]|nr:penicillin-binding transpeptidase domain-containing protein [Ruminococcus flavefaciens]HQL99595.1 penicillin-binding transpeptidase domain-containing protein [Ruminococcus flavefaciens]